MKCLFFAIIAHFLTSCTQADPRPELRDEVYIDLETELGIAEKAFDAEEKQQERLQTDMSKALPQTGQIKYATQKIRQAEDLMGVLKQQKLYFEIKLETRKSLVVARYNESKKSGGRLWPDKEELELYKTVMKLNRDKNIWTKTKGTKKNVPRGTTPGAEERR